MQSVMSPISEDGFGLGLISDVAAENKKYDHYLFASYLFSDLE